MTNEKTVPCQWCGDNIPAEQLQLHLAEHSVGKIPTRSIGEVCTRQGVTIVGTVSRGCVVAVVPGRCAECSTPVEHVEHVKRLLADGSGVTIGLEPIDNASMQALAELCTDEAFQQLTSLNERRLADALANGTASSCSYCAEILLDTDPMRITHLRACRERYLAAHTVDATWDEETADLPEIAPIEQWRNVSGVPIFGGPVERAELALTPEQAAAHELDRWKKAAETNALENAALKNHMNRAGIPFPTTPEYAFALGQVAAEQLTGANNLRWECSRGCVNWGVGTHCSSCGRARDLEADDLAGNTLGWKWQTREGRSELELMLGCQFCGTHHCVNLVVQQGGQIWHQVPAGVWLQPRTAKHPHVRCAGCLAPPLPPEEAADPV